MPRRQTNGGAEVVLPPPLYLVQPRTKGLGPCESCAHLGTNDDTDADALANADADADAEAEDADSADDDDDRGDDDDEDDDDDDDDDGELMQVTPHRKIVMRLIPQALVLGRSTALVQQSPRRCRRRAPGRDSTAQDSDSTAQHRTEPIPTSGPCRPSPATRDVALFGGEANPVGQLVTVACSWDGNLHGKSQYSRTYALRGGSAPDGLVLEQTVVRYRVTPSDDCDHVVPTAHAYAHVPTALGAVTSHHCMMMRPPTARLACMTCVPSRPSFRDSNKQQQDNPAGIISIGVSVHAAPPNSQCALLSGLLLGRLHTRKSPRYTASHTLGVQDEGHHKWRSGPRPVGQQQSKGTVQILVKVAMLLLLLNRRDRHEPTVGSTVYGAPPGNVKSRRNGSQQRAAAMSDISRWRRIQAYGRYNRMGPVLDSRMPCHTPLPPSLPFSVSRIASRRVTAPYLARRPSGISQPVSQPDRPGHRLTGSQAHSLSSPVSSLMLVGRGRGRGRGVGKAHVAELVTHAMQRKGWHPSAAPFCKVVHSRALVIGCAAPIKATRNLSRNLRLLLRVVWVGRYACLLAYIPMPPSAAPRLPPGGRARAVWTHCGMHGVIALKDRILIIARARYLSISRQHTEKKYIITLADVTVIIYGSSTTCT
ncbi:uncharacterized protein SEPMUDRAFT_104152 [Sphaerulina musiva SO2202]|uniref:Uncharacterized protein n=1 Tax=Sphaerulina musiva (strain SO2202) TaxID=692275 RepID=N1QKL4_SPHMS|nr:uncharacterized protein SEPMUDRAFT_104152 [Sphaerulina musiva SO2202]EMF16822.1 hypothetical protein SEPMUDRAFT_104152 [Sphaerulina musiva SO2202]